MTEFLAAVWQSNSLGSVLTAGAFLFILLASIFIGSPDMFTRLWTLEVLLLAVGIVTLLLAGYWNIAVFLMAAALKAGVAVLVIIFADLYRTRLKKAY